MTRITKFYPLARRFKVASERLVECDLRDPHGEFPDLRAEVRQEIDAIALDAQQAGYALDDLSEYVVAEEERRANVDQYGGLLPLEISLLMPAIKAGKAPSDRPLWRFRLLLEGYRP